MGAFMLGSVVYILLTARVIKAATAIRFAFICIVITSAGATLSGGMPFVMGVTCLAMQVVVWKLAARVFRRHP
jgi:hypothetical protein